LPTYLYTAKTSDNKTVTDSHEASSELDLARLLKDEGLFLISVNQTDDDQQKKRSWLDFANSLRGVPLIEKILFSQHLAVMINAGLPITRALDALAAQTKNGRFSKIITQINNDIKRGTPLADAIAKYPKVFPGLFVNMVKVGEASGNLEKVLQILTQQMRKEHDLLSAVRGAMVYPAVIISAMFGIGTLMMIMVVPKLTQIFKETKAELPFTTKIVIAISDFLSAHWAIAIIGLLMLIMLISFILKTKGGKIYLDWLILHLPVFSDLSRKINSARIARTLGSLIESGVPIIRGLQIVSGTLSNFFFYESLQVAAQEIQKGGSLAQIFKNYPQLYPAMVMQMIEVGEETGTLGGTLSHLADFYEEDVNAATKSLTSIIEPILMIVIGTIVGFFAVSMIQPLYTIMQEI